MNEGLLDDDTVSMIGKAVAAALRFELRERGDVAKADALAHELRRRGVTSFAVDNYVVLTLAAAEQLLAKLPE